MSKEKHEKIEVSRDKYGISLKTTQTTVAKDIFPSPEEGLMEISARSKKAINEAYLMFTMATLTGAASIYELAEAYHSNDANDVLHALAMIALFSIFSFDFKKNYDSKQLNDRQINALEEEINRNQGGPDNNQPFTH